MAGYTKIRRWPYWEEPTLLVEGFGPYHNIASSLSSNNLMVLWTTFLHPGPIDSAGYRLSTDGGDTWGEITYLPFPPAFSPGSETIPSFRSIYGFFDQDENIHIVASLYPVVRDTMRLIPAETWHYCPNNNLKIMAEPGEPSGNYRYNRHRLFPFSLDCRGS